MYTRVNLARLLAVLAFITGVVGFILTMAEHPTRITAAGWFTGGTLLGVLSLLAFVDDYLDSRRSTTT